ncbi:MAG: hypothetical protein R2703_03875 [Micropruina glycogenica]
MAWALAERVGPGRTVVLTAPFDVLRRRVEQAGGAHANSASGRLGRNCATTWTASTGPAPKSRTG